jgi:hypothetical protein
MITASENSQITAVANKLKVPINLVGIFSATSKRILTIARIAKLKISPIDAGKQAFGEIAVLQSFGYI